MSTGPAQPCAEGAPERTPVIERVLVIAILVLLLLLLLRALGVV